MEDQYIVINGENGQHVKAWIKGVSVEPGAVEQLKKAASLDIVYPFVAVMPDVHIGIGATVGSVIPTYGAIIPAAVGVDIGCVDKNTEFLTKNGWKKISEYKEDDDVLVYSNPIAGTGGTAFFEKPKSFVKKPCDEFWHISTKYGVDQMLCDEHRCLVYKYDRSYTFSEYEIVSADYLATKHNSLANGYRHRFLTTFKYEADSSVFLSDNELRVMVMVCADGCFDSRRSDKVCQLRLKKKRKIVRARDTLESANIGFTETQHEDGVTTFRFVAPERNKTLSNYWASSVEQLKVIVDEIFYWDGNHDERCFYTRDKDSADFMNFAFTACGHRSTITTDDRDGSLDYRVFAHDNLKVGINGAPKTAAMRVSSLDGFKYCFVTSTGFWVMRRNGNVCVTGNCGMMATKTNLKAEDLPLSLKEMRNKIERDVPHGRAPRGRDFGSWQRGDIPKQVSKAWRNLEPRFNVLSDKHRRIKNSNNEVHLGTLGTGNHFIEICLDEQNQVWVMLHSGSRGVGNCIGTYFIELAKKDMEGHIKNLPDKDLAYFSEGSPHFDDYVQAVSWAQDFAMVNREIMMENVLKAMHNTPGVPGFKVEKHAVNCHHNYVTKEFHFGKDVFVTRKGAVKAGKGDWGIIPGSMGACSYIVQGLGNPNSFHSCSHGAGRCMSRTKAKHTFSLDDHIKATEGVECRKDLDVIDETPMAYKDIDAVMEAQKDLVEIKTKLKQILCVKG